MQFPERPRTHVIESSSLKVFNNVIVDEWLVRELTEQDYGIDLQLEIFENSQATGKILQIQLKGSDAPSYDKTAPFVTYYGIKSSTINYWSSLPIPVIFVFVDTNTKDCFYCNINHYIRDNYNDFKKQNLHNIKIPTSQILQLATSSKIINDIYNQEMQRAEFERQIYEFMSSTRTYQEVLQEHYDPYSVMPIVDGDENKIHNLLNVLKKLCSHFSISWNAPSINDISSPYGSKFCTAIYERKLSKYSQSIIDTMRKIAREICNLVLTTERNYWYYKDLNFYNDLSSFNPDIEIEDLQ